MDCNDDRAAAEEGNRRNRKANRQIRTSARIFFKSEIALPANPQRLQEWPEQDQSSDEQGAMEIAFEINPREARQNAVGDERLAQPKERGRHKCSQ